jgi:hypothetical protein
LVIKTTTWQRDSHGLFDYEGKESDRKQIKATGTCKHPFFLAIVSLMRDKTNVEVRYNEDEDNRLEESKEEDIPLTQIAKIVEKHGTNSNSRCCVGDYWIYHKSTLEESEEEIEKNPEGKLWNVVKHSKVTEGDPYKIALESSRLTKGGFEELGYTIMPNDVIKLGRVRFKVREIVSPAYAMLRREEGHRLMKMKED